MVRLHSIQASVHSCDDMEAANRAAGAIKPADPGPVNLAQVTPPQFQALLERLPIGQPSPPLIAESGVTLVMICSKSDQPAGLPSREQIAAAAVQQSRRPGRGADAGRSASAGLIQIMEINASAGQHAP